jgi:hypothetical protein
MQASWSAIPSDAQRLIRKVAARDFGGQEWTPAHDVSGACLPYPDLPAAVGSIGSIKQN